MPSLSASLQRRAARFGLARLALAGALSLGGNAALAQEQLIMPYACHVAGGRVTLQPSRDEAYRIYGEREERPHTICSPINPNVCRTWLLHRFELDCGGTRVDWMAVVEAASEQTTGRAWVEDGRLRMRMNQYWGRDTASDDPCPRWRQRGRRDDDCNDRDFRRSRAVVEMPAGFAPAFGLPVRFARLDPHTLPPDAYSSPGSPYPGKAPPEKSARLEPPREVPAKNPPAKSSQVAGTTPGTPSTMSTGPLPGTPPALPKSAGRPGVVPPADTPAEAKTKRAEPVREAAAEPVTPSGTVTIIPKIINRPAGSAAPEQSSAGQVAPPKPAPPAAAKPPEPVQPKVGEAKPVPEPVPITRRPDTADAPAGHSTLSAYAPSSTVQAIVGFAGLIAAALALFAWTRRREQLSLAAAGVREFGTVTLDARKTGTALAGPRAAGVGTTHRPPPLPQPEAAVAFPSDGDIPRTREEACRVLGASPDAGEPAIRKIVEGLRQSWHPDLAASEADRQLREQRTTQINVAWEILSGKRPAA